MTDLLACLRLARTDGIGPGRWRQMIERYHTPQAAVEALPHMRIKGRAPFALPSVDHITHEIEQTLKLGGQFLTVLDPAYPPQLRACPDAPPVLSVLGDCAALSKPGVGLVGARNASVHGVRLAESLATDLVEAGLTVISGLARGIDRAAHMGALHRKGVTIAAIAGGLDRPYPPENVRLQAEIAEKGVVVTEAPLGTIPTARHFPRRNRLIAGLGLGCVVVEAALHSGTLITARLALDYGRDLFAVPGTPLDPRCRGSNDLLRHGAILTESAADILAHLPPLSRFASFPDSALTQENTSQRVFYSPPAETLFTSLPTSGQPHHISGQKPPKSAEFQSPPSVDPVQSPPPAQPITVQEKLLDLLSFTPIPVDDLVRHCQFSASAVLTALTELELTERITLLPGGRVALANEAGKRAD